MVFWRTLLEQLFFLDDTDRSYLRGESVVDVRHWSPYRSSRIARHNSRTLESVLERAWSSRIHQVCVCLIKIASNPERPVAIFGYLVMVRNRRTVSRRIKVPRPVAMTRRGTSVVLPRGALGGAMSVRPSARRLAEAVRKWARVTLTHPVGSMRRCRSAWTNGTGHPCAGH